MCAFNNFCPYSTWLFFEKLSFDECSDDEISFDEIPFDEISFERLSLNCFLKCVKWCFSNVSYFIDTLKYTCIAMKWNEWNIIVFWHYHFLFSSVVLCVIFCSVLFIGVYKGVLAPITERRRVEKGRGSQIKVNIWSFKYVNE